jgi:hypothetical protein
MMGALQNVRKWRKRTHAAPALRFFLTVNLKLRPGYRASKGDSSENAAEDCFVTESTWEKSMKVAALAALSVLIALPADAGQHQRQNNISPLYDS